MSKLKAVLKAIVPILVLAAGFGAFRVLKATKAEPPRSQRQTPGVLVSVEPVSSGTHEVSIRAHGTVVPARRVRLAAEVGGRVTWVDEKLVPGGHFRQGESLFRVDGRDYAIAVQRTAADVNRAQLELEVEQGRAVVAQREWEAFGEPEGQIGEAGRALALREPQIRTARVGVDAAEATRRRAQLDLSRTTAKAPWNAMVVEEQVEPGQVMAPGAAAATLVGTDEFWVQVSVPVASLAAIAMPDDDGEGGAAARIVHDVEGQRIERSGHVVRLLPDLDPAGGMARLLVAVTDPLGLSLPEAQRGLPLLLGAFVRVQIDAAPLTDVVEVPRAAVAEGDKVYVLGGGETLDIREVRVAWRLEDTVLVSDGLAAGERIITSRIATPVQGMQLRLPAPPGAPPAAAGDGAGDTGGAR